MIANFNTESDTSESEPTSQEKKQYALEAVRKRLGEVPEVRVGMMIVAVLVMFGCVIGLTLAIVGMIYRPSTGPPGGQKLFGLMLFLFPLAMAGRYVVVRIGWNSERKELVELDRRLTAELEALERDSKAKKI